MKADWAAPNHDVATLLATRGRLDEAAQYFRKALALRPDHAETQDPKNAQAKANLDKLSK